MSRPWSAQSWATSGWQQSSWEESANQWYEADHRYGDDSRQSTLGKNQGDAELPSHVRPSKNYLDETLVYRSTLKRYIEPSAWSRAKGIAGKPVQDVKLTDLTHKGTQEWMIRGLSHGKFTGVVLTKSIAESVLTARLLSALREKRVDIDETVKAIHKDKTKKAIPDKTSEATKFIQPLVDVVMEQLQPYLVTMDQTTTSSGDAKGFQDMQQDSAKLRQKLQQAGIPITPVKRKSLKRQRNKQDQVQKRKQLWRITINLFRYTQRPPRRGRPPMKERARWTSSMSPQMCCRTTSLTTSATQKRGCPTSAKTLARQSRNSSVPMSTRCSRSLRTKRSRRMSCRLWQQDGAFRFTWSAQPLLRTCKASLRWPHGTACDAFSHLSTNHSILLRLPQLSMSSKQRCSSSSFSLVSWVNLFGFPFHRSTATSTAKKLREKLKQKGCIPELYTFPRFQRVNAVYMPK